jgi:hypothetical protein
MSELLDAACGGASLMGAYQQYELDGQRNLWVYAPREAFNGLSPEQISQQASSSYFAQNGGRNIGVDVLRTDESGNVVGRYGFIESAPEDRTAPWMLNDNEVRPFLQPQVEAMRELGARADGYADEAVRQYEAAKNDPNNEGYGFYDYQSRADAAYQQLDVMAADYRAVRDTEPPLDTRTITPLELQGEDFSGGTGGGTAPTATTPTIESTQPAQESFE